MLNFIRKLFGKKEDCDKTTILPVQMQPAQQWLFAPGIRKEAMAHFVPLGWSYAETGNSWKLTR